MRGITRIGRVLVSIVAGMSLVPVTVSEAEGAVAACPAIGTRVKVSSSPSVYLIEPNGDWGFIPTETDYFHLFASWSGLVVVNSYACSNITSLAGAVLVKKPGDPKTYIWDAEHGLYRWIRNEAAFNRYHFDWSKIQTRSSFGPIGGSAWDWT
jgi:hypothetical protein